MTESLVYLDSSNIFFRPTQVASSSNAAEVCTDAYLDDHKFALALVANLQESFTGHVLRRRETWIR